jgi:hypothetical protein
VAGDEKGKVVGGGERVKRTVREREVKEEIRKEEKR